MPHYSLVLFVGLLVILFAESAPVAKRPLRQKPLVERKQKVLVNRAQLPFRPSQPFPINGRFTRTTGYTLSPTGYIPFTRPTSSQTPFLPTTTIPTTAPAPTSESALTSEPAPTTTAPAPTSDPAPTSEPAPTVPSQNPTTSLITSNITTSGQQATVTSTQPSPSNAPSSTGPNQLKLSLQNTLDSDNVHAYITGLDSTGRVVMVTAAGVFFYPSTSEGTTPQIITADVAIPLARGAQTQLTIPDYISGARVWFADGTLSFSAVQTALGLGLVEPTVVNSNDPDSDVNWGFVELTYLASYGLFANLSFVDFVGMPLGLQLTTTSGQSQSAPGLPPDAVEQLCEKLKSQESLDQQPWSQLCEDDADGNLLRVLSPTSLIYQNNNSDVFADYWTSYIDEVWSKYTTETLIINSQSAAGDISCTSDGSTITCEGDSGTYNKPGPADIFGCNSGPFTVLESDNDIHRAVVPRICAAIHRSTLHRPEGNIQPKLPPAEYYLGRVLNWYSKLVHEVEIDGKGYAFPYDDVAPSTADDTAGIVSAPNPELLTIIVGGSS